MKMKKQNQPSDATLLKAVEFLMKTAAPRILEEERKQREGIKDGKLN